MFINIQKYNFNSTSPGYWGVEDSKRGLYHSGWSTFRPIPLAIISVYREWQEPILPALKSYYGQLSKKEAMDKLNTDLKTMSDLFYPGYGFDKYYPCIKNHLKRLQFTGKLK